MDTHKIQCHPPLLDDSIHRHLVVCAPPPSLNFLFFCSIRVVLKESKRLVLSRTSCAYKKVDQFGNSEAEPAVAVLQVDVTALPNFNRYCIKYLPNPGCALCARILVTGFVCTENLKSCAFSSVVTGSVSLAEGKI
jgi:hypothetical protein